jgi:hypothetical protein
MTCRLSRRLLVCDCVQRFRTEVRVAPQHLPVLVAGDQRDLLDFEPRLEEPARALMAQVVEMQVLDL